MKTNIREQIEKHIRGLSADTVLNQILEQLSSLKREELRQIHRAVQEYLLPQDEERKREAFHQALLASGLVKQIKKPLSYQLSARRLVQVQGKSVSETIIEERR